MNELLDLCRAVNVALTLLTAAWLGIRFNDQWTGLPWGRRLVLAGPVLLLLVGAYGSAEAYIQGAPAGARTVLVTLACLVTLLGLLRSRHEP